MIEIKIKPLSINKSFKGRRFKTKECKEYEEEIFYTLPNIEMPKGKLQLDLIFGFKNKLSDIDNPVKIFTDILQKKYDFDDRDIYRMTIEKQIVKEEFIKFKIKKYVST